MLVRWTPSPAVSLASPRLINPHPRSYYPSRHARCRYCPHQPQRQVNSAGLWQGGSRLCPRCRCTFTRTNSFFFCLVFRSHFTALDLQTNASSLYPLHRCAGIRATPPMSHRSCLLAATWLLWPQITLSASLKLILAVYSFSSVVPRLQLHRTKIPLLFFLFVHRHVCSDARLFRCWL